MLKTKNITSDIYSDELYSIFENNGWIDRPNVQEVYNNFMRRLSQMKNEGDIKLILDLTKRYLWLNSTQYLDHLISAFDLWQKDHKNSTRIIFVPVLAKETDEIKSGHFMLYFLYDSIVTKLKHAKKKVELIADYEKLRSLNLRKANIVMIDDYIGSGQSVTDAIMRVRSKLRYDPKDISVISLVAQEEGVDKLCAEGIKVFSSIICGKGITDYYPLNEVDEKKRQMVKISKDYINNKEYYLGYGNSEALVTMNRTPNNTFPFYWKDSKTSFAPFSRVK